VRSEPEAIPKMFLKTVEEFGPSIAMRRKHRGVWKEITWNDYRDHVQALYHGLKQLGLGRGDVVCILSNNRPEWVYADLACQSAGALPLGIYAESLETELEYLINHHRARFVVAEDQEQADKVLKVLDKLPTLDKCIVIDGDGMEEYDHAVLIMYEDVEKMGCQPAASDELKRDVEKISLTDAAFLSLTSGTTGKPKSVILTHQSILAMAQSFMGVEHYDRTDQLISYVPLPWIVERCFSVIFHFKAAYQIHFPESTELDVLFQNMREICPSVLNCTTSVWEKLCATVYMRHQNASPLKRNIFKLFMPIAGRVAQSAFKREPVSLRLAFLNFLGDILLYRKIRERLGLRLLRCAYTGGTAAGPEVYAFYHMIGVDIRQLYSVTEIGGVCVGQHPGEADPETTGKAFPGVELKLSESNEILVRSPYFVGYYNDPALGPEVCKNGWLSTGDRGFIDHDGHVVVLGRLADMIETANGHKVQPELIENRLKFSPYIKEVIAVGKARPYIAALIQIDRDSVGTWAQKRGIPYTTFRDLASKPEVMELIGEAVAKVNEKLDKPSRVMRYKLLQKELDPDDEELTKTRKVRRSFIGNRYKHLIDSMYRE